MSDPAAMPEGSLPLSVELCIDAVCQAFKAAWPRSHPDRGPSRSSGKMTPVLEIP
jgi:hypothetical protein